MQVQLHASLQEFLIFNALSWVHLASSSVSLGCNGLHVGGELHVGTRLGCIMLYSMNSQGGSEVIRTIHQCKLQCSMPVFSDVLDMYFFLHVDISAGMHWRHCAIYGWKDDK